jgi:thiosulfate/3-mercaptopyruvate sulfurtransferase
MPEGFIHPELIVDTDWLATHLTDPQVRVLDATTHLIARPNNVLYDVKPGREDFEQAHIPGAAFVDIEHELSMPGVDLHFMLPTEQRFADAMGRLGVGDDTFVVAYSTANHWWATRLWWMLRAFGHARAAVLNGGFQKWQREGRPVEKGPAKPARPAPFTARLRSSWVVGKNEVLAAIGESSICTLNALRPEQHAGTGGTSYGRLGHIAGSINVPAIHAVDADNCFKSATELRAMFASALAKPTVITYCGGGIAATSAALVLTMLGHTDVKLYDASMSEWAADQSLPMQTGS